MLLGFQAPAVQGFPFSEAHPESWQPCQYPLPLLRKSWSIRPGLDPAGRQARSNAGGELRGWGWPPSGLAVRFPCYTQDPHYVGTYQEDMQRLTQPWVEGTSSIFMGSSGGLCRAFGEFEVWWQDPWASLPHTS